MFQQHFFLLALKSNVGSTLMSDFSLETCKDSFFRLSENSLSPRCLGNFGNIHFEDEISVISCVTAKFTVTLHFSIAGMANSWPK